jgi:hypothetical protein
MTQARQSLFAAAALVLLSLAVVAPSHASTITLYESQSAFDSAATTSLLEDFEAFTPKDTPFSSITSHGVFYTGFAGAPFPNVWVASPGYNNFGAGVGTTTTSILTANGDEDILMTFTMTPLAVGFDVYFNGLGPVTLTVTNTAFTAVFTDGRNLDTLGYYGIVSTDPILSIRFTSTDGGRLNTGIDNISISSAPEVPEPTTLALLGAGVLGLGRMRKRR